MYDGSWTKDPNVRRMFMNGRSLSIMLVITMQYPLGIPPDLRTQIDYTFIFRNNLISNRTRIYENHARLFPSFDVFCQVMDQCTENFGCIVIDNTATSNRLEDQVFWYKAESHANFRIGDSAFWALSKQMCGNAEDDDGEEMFDAGSMRKRAGPLVNVKKQPFQVGRR